jgi:uroporphyrinogen decarboxylase
MPRLGIRAAGNRLGLAAPLWDSHFLRACRGEPTPVTPVWLMRQAGRYMAHYRGIRARGSFLDLCKDPAAAAEVALYAREWLGVDAAIVFSDILVVLEALGLPLEFAEGEGPRLPRPITSERDLDALLPPTRAVESLGYVHEAVRQTVRGLPRDIPCIGFCGGPFTLAAYAIEGGGSRQFARAKAFMYREPRAWSRLLGALVDALAPYLAAQIAAGASCVQIFESWVGELTREDFAELVAPHLTRLIGLLPEGVPVIAFGAGTGHLLDLIAGCGADVVGVDTHADIAGAFALRGAGGAPVAVQGNLDPCLLLAPREGLLAGADRVLAAAAGRAGHIFNLGHGVLKETDPEQARALVAHVHERSAARAR